MFNPELLADAVSVSSSELARISEMDKSATSKAVTALLAKGLVERTHHASDRRFIDLALTESGRKLYNRILPVVSGINQEIMSDLTQQEMELLESLLTRMQKTLKSCATGYRTCQGLRGGTAAHAINYRQLTNTVKTPRQPHPSDRAWPAHHQAWRLPCQAPREYGVFCGLTRRSTWPVVPFNLKAAFEPRDSTKIQEWPKPKYPKRVLSHAAGTQVWRPLVQGCSIYR